MKIILTTLDGNIYPVEVSSDLEIINLKALCEQETGISSARMSLTFNGQPLNEANKTLANYSINENDIIVVQAQAAASNPSINVPLIDFGSINVPRSRPISSRNSQQALTPNLSNMLQMLMSDPSNLESIRQRFPDLANAIQQNDTGRITQLMNQISHGDLSSMATNQQSEFDLENQRRIAEAIRLENIQQNMEHALEYMPEAFGNVIMLYINCQVNGHQVKAFVDSGAQMTIMSSACAERCGIMRLADTRWSGIAKGVGTQKIVGRVHLAQIQIEDKFLTTAFSILENQPMDMLLGLDLLKRHQCVIDLEKNLLIIKSANVETKFLSESELPPSARLNFQDSSEDIKMVENKPTSSTSHSETAITNLTSLGYSRNDAIEALNSSNGNEDMAKVKLLAKSLQPPKK